MQDPSFWDVVPDYMIKISTDAKIDKILTIIDDIDETLIAKTFVIWISTYLLMIIFVLSFDRSITLAKSETSISPPS